MKKLFTILLVCTFAFSTVTFVGCGGDDTKTDTTNTDTDDTETDEGAAGDDDGNDDTDDDAAN